MEESDILNTEIVEKTIEAIITTYTERIGVLVTKVEELETQRDELYREKTFWENRNKRNEQIAMQLNEERKKIKSICTSGSETSLNDILNIVDPENTNELSGNRE